MRYVIFRLDRDRYALPLAAVREVVPAPDKLTRVPRAPASLRGVMNLRGRVVPVVELRKLLALDGEAMFPATRVVLLDRGRRDLGLLITDVDGIEVIEKVGPSPARGNAAILGLTRLGALAVTVLDPDGLDSAVAQSFASR